jgi:hypothetical protein
MTGQSEPAEGDVRRMLIGHDGEEVVDSATTQQQIHALEALESALVDGQGEPIAWGSLDDPAEPRSPLQCILRDRRIRVDQKTAMAEPPPIAVVTVVGDTVVRFEFYQGRHALAKTYDLRSPELRGQDLRDWIGGDP